MFDDGRQRHNKSAPHPQSAQAVHESSAPAKSGGAALPPGNDLRPRQSAIAGLTGIQAKAFARQRSDRSKIL